MVNCQSTIAFALAGKADADNIAPAIWSVARDATQVLVYVADDEVYKDLQTAWWRSDCSHVRVIRVRNNGSSSFINRLYRARWNRWSMRRQLRHQNVGLVVMEWREGIPLFSPKRVRWTFGWLSHNFFTQIQLAARDVQVPTVALPHGHSTKTSIIRSKHVQAVMDANGGKLPFADRDSHTAYVFASGYHRDVMVNHSTMSGHNTQVWGSARFNDAWVARLYVAAPPAQLPALRSEQLRRVLLFVPKWHNLVDKARTLQLIAALGAERRIQLVVRGHLRADDTSLSAQDQAMFQESDNIVMVKDHITSPSLIKACDVLIDVDSSIAFDAVLLGKPYVRPRYLQDASVTTIWDELGGAHQTDSLQATIELVSNAVLQPAPRDPTFDEVVFGGTGADVLQRYRDGLLALMDR
jgi:hypothetical protein